MHVIFGLGALVFMMISIGRSQLERLSHAMIESCGIFRHLVDLLWLILFALFYVL